MADIPITLRCECGQTHSVKLGDTVDCACGRMYDTRELEQTRLVGVRHSQAKMRIYITFGILLIVGVASSRSALGDEGDRDRDPGQGSVLVPPPRADLRRRVFYGAGELPTWQLAASQGRAGAVSAGAVVAGAGRRCRRATPAR